MKLFAHAEYMQFNCMKSMVSTRFALTFVIASTNYLVDTVHFPAISTETYVAIATCESARIRTRISQFYPVINSVST